MTAPDTSHAGIDLDVISLSAYGQKPAGNHSKQIAVNCEDGKIFVQSLFRKMTAHDTFLSFSGQISNVNKIVNRKYSSADDIARVILKDLALTTRILNLVNSSFYRHFSSKGISTISEAMIILGTEEIRLAAANLKVYEMMQGLAQIGILKEMTYKGLQRSIMVRQIAEKGHFRDADTMQVSAMVYDLGEYLAALFAPDEYVAIALMAEEKNMSIHKASKSVLGISYTDLGRMMVIKLHFPENVLNTMQPVSNFTIPKDTMVAADFQRYICSFVKKMCDIPQKITPEDRKKCITGIVHDFQKILAIDLSMAEDLLKDSWEKTLQHAAVLTI